MANTPMASGGRPGSPAGPPPACMGCLPPGQNGGQLHGQNGTGHMAHELGEAHADEAEHCGTGGGDLGRHLGRAAADALPLKVGDHLGGLSHLIDLVKADLQQAVEHNIHAVQVLELPIQGGLRQGHAVLVLLQNVQTVAHRLDGLVGTDADTASAVDAPVGQNGGLAAADPDGLGGAALDAGGAAPAALQLQDHRMSHGHGAASPRFSKLIALRKP